MSLNPAFITRYGPRGRALWAPAETRTQDMTKEELLAMIGYLFEEIEAINRQHSHDLDVLAGNFRR